MTGHLVPDLQDTIIYREGRHHETWAALRRRSPVVHMNSPAVGPFWSVLAYEPAARVLADHSTFSSTNGMRLGADSTATAAATGKMLVVTDPPRHSKIRRVISSAFTPRMVRRLELTMREIAIDVTEAILERGGGNFAETAARLPLSIICDMLGVPRHDWDFMLDRTMTAFGVGGPSEEAAIQAHVDLFMYYEDLMRLRRENPQDDIVTALVNGSIDGVAVTNEEVVLNCNGLISGGNETTRHASIGGLLAFIQNPDQWRLLQKKPEHLDSAVQEVLRYTAPAMHVMRTATKDVNLEGADIAAGDRVAVWLGSANRDELKFEDPAKFDITRFPNRHLSFAFGPHFCIGGPLAVTELTILFQELSERIGDVELDGEVVRMASNLINGYETLPVRVNRRNGG